MMRLSHLGVAAVLVVLCSWAVHAQGGGVGDGPPPPMDPGGAPATGQPPAQSSHEQGQIVLESRVLHLGDEEYGAGDPFVQTPCSGGVWKVTFITDRPITGLVVFENVREVNSDNVATVRLGGSEEPLLSGTILGTVDYANNVAHWASPRLGFPAAGFYTLSVASNDREYLGVDDFLFGPTVLLYEPAEAMVTLANPGTGTVGGTPTMQYQPLIGTALDQIAGGTGTTWAGVWHVANTGYTMTFLRRNGVDGFTGVAIPFAAGDDPVVLDTDGVQWVAPGAGGQWQNLTEVHLPFAIASSIPASGAMADAPAVLGPWYVNFIEAEGVRWIVLNDGLDQISLSDQGKILYMDTTIGETYCFAE